MTATNFLEENRGNYTYFPSSNTDAYGNVLTTITDEKPSLVDETDGTEYYIGYAVPGTLTSDAQWKIYKIYIVDTVWHFSYAENTAAYVHVWDLRTTYTYN